MQTQHSALKNSLIAAFFGAIVLFSLSSHATTYTLQQFCSGNPTEVSQFFVGAYPPATQPTLGLPQTDFFEAYSENSSGQLAGTSWFNDSSAPSGKYYTATVWTNGIPVNIGNLSKYENSTFATYINDLGQVIGYGISDDIPDGYVNAGLLYISVALLWENGNVFNLNDLVSNSVLGNWNLEIATAINDNGWITGVMSDTDSGALSTFLLTPDAPSAVPLPAAVWLFGSAIGGFGVMRRRKI